MASQEEDKKKKRKREDVQEEHPVEPTKKVKAQKKDKNPVANWKLLKVCQSYITPDFHVISR